jgi:hypothetical protein
MRFDIFYRACERTATMPFYVKGNREMKENTTSTTPTITDLGQLISYVRFATCLHVKGIIEGKRVDQRMCIAPIGTRSGFYICPDVTAKSMLDEDDKCFSGCVRIEWGYLSSKVKLLADGFRLNGLEFRYVPVADWPDIPVPATESMSPVPVKVFPAWEIDDYIPLVTYLQHCPYVLLSGDLNRDHFACTVVHVIVFYDEIFVDFVDERGALRIPRSKPIEYYNDRFSMGRLSFEYLDGPDPGPTCRTERP